MKKKVLGVVVTLVFLIWILYKINLDEVTGAVRLFSPVHLYYIIIFYVIALFLRGMRWKLFLGNLPKYSWLELSGIFTIGTMFNIFLPARAGDLYRAYYLGTIMDDKKMKIFGSVILERLFDGTAVFILLLYAVKTYFSTSEIINITTAAAGIVFLGSLSVAFVLFRGGNLNKILCFVEHFIEKMPKLDQKLSSFFENLKIYANSFSDGFSLLNNPTYSLSALIYSIVIWILECMVAYLIINSFGLNFPISTSLFVISLTTFSTMLPSTSIFLGPFQAAYILALGIYGADKELALAVSVVHNIILASVVTVIGLICLFKFNIEYGKNSINR